MIIKMITSGEGSRIMEGGILAFYVSFPFFFFFFKFIYDCVGSLFLREGFL